MPAGADARAEDLGAHGLKLGRAGHADHGARREGAAAGGVGEGGSAGTRADAAAFAPTSSMAACGASPPRWRRCSRARRRAWARTIGRIARAAAMGWRIRKLGRRDMRELLRIGGMNVYDLLEENFESPR
jgi:hypothetical protein